MYSGLFIMYCLTSQKHYFSHSYDETINTYNKSSLKDTVYQYLTLNNLQIAFYQRQIVI
jgi:hypothetical protein